ACANRGAHALPGGRKRFRPESNGKGSSPRGAAPEHLARPTRSAASAPCSSGGGTSLGCEHQSASAAAQRNRAIDGPAPAHGVDRHARELLVATAHGAQVLDDSLSGGGGVLEESSRAPHRTS